MDYINKTDAINALSSKGHFAAAKALWDLPTADVVEVIRCKECKYFLDPWGCEFLGDGCRVNKNGYCFFAERRG